jgi:putative DNA primase/helicase
MLRTCVRAPSKYLQYKGFGDMPSLVLPDGALFVPMYSLAGDIQGAQVIRWSAETRSHEKKMLPGMRAKGAVHRIGPRNAVTTILCEGFATALSINAACDQMRLSASVLVCFSDSNLVYVAPHVTGDRIVFADNDTSGAGERAAVATGLRYCMSGTEGYDANDMHCKEGLMPVCAAIMGARREMVAA